MNAVPPVRPPGSRQRGFPRFCKVLFDRLAAAVALCLTAPLIGVVALVIALERRGPVFFTQVRPGLGGVPFRIYKFRTMRDAYGPDGLPLPDGERLTRLGCFLRRTSLDELPQLWNVLRGELSLVGPRPLLMEYLPRYSRDQARRHDVSPGITGWAQVHGRNALSWEEKLAHDVWYVDHWSLALDLKIILRTFVRVFRGEGVLLPGSCRMGVAGLSASGARQGPSSTQRTSDS